YVDWMRASVFFFFSRRRRHTRCYRDWSSDVCSSDLANLASSSIAGAGRVCVTGFSGIGDAGLDGTGTAGLGVEVDSGFLAVEAGSGLGIATGAFTVASEGFGAGAGRRASGRGTSETSGLRS